MCHIRRVLGVSGDTTGGYSPMWRRYYAKVRFPHAILMFLACWVVEGSHIVLGFGQVNKCYHIVVTSLR